ncbi:MAG: sugar phosphate isomerase/epimerase [Clostridia bacterium]|nr:sugar phosphate isomerase/epimerase [Clostridia bacterium]
MNNFKYGCTSMELENFIIAKNAGITYGELSFGGIYNLTKEEAEKYKKFSVENDFPFEAANCMIPGSIRVVGDEVDYDRIDEYLEKAFDTAHYLGVEQVIFGSSGARNIPDGYDRDKAYAQLKIYLKDHVAPLCDKYDMYCAIENLSYSESNVFNTLEESYKMVEACGSDRIKALVDFYHFGRNNDSTEWLYRCKDIISHIHTASVLNDRFFPAPGDGEDYSVQVNLLRDIGYDRRQGRISFEARVPDGKPLADCFKESVDIFKNL